MNSSFTEDYTAFISLVFLYIAGFTAYQIKEILWGLFLIGICITAAILIFYVAILICYRLIEYGYRRYKAYLERKEQEYFFVNLIAILSLTPITNKDNQ